MTWKHTATALLTGGALIVGVSACGSNDSGGGSGDSYTVGIANFTMSGPYFSGMDAAIQARAKQKDVETISTDANGDAAQLASNVEDLITRGVDAVIVSGGPLESAPAVLNSLQAADIPAILVDRKFQTGDYTSWIGPDNQRIGVQDGEYLKKQLPDGGKIGIIKGGPADNSIGLARTDGLKSVFDGDSAYTLVDAPSYGEWDSDGGLKVMENMLASDPDLNAVFCENDAMCLGAQRAIANANLTDKIIIAGVDGQKEALQAIAKKSNYKVTGLNSAGEIGSLGLDRAIAVLEGQDVEKDTVVPSPQITQANAQTYLDKGTF